MRQPKLRVLIAEDAPYEAAAALRSLYGDSDGRLEFSSVTTLGALLPTISMVNADVLVLHIGFSSGDPAQMVRHVHRASPKIPIVVFADSQRKEEAMRCLALGAMGCLLKDTLDREICDRLLRSVVERSTVDSLADLLRDPITGLYLREALLTLGTQIVEGARRTQGKIVLFCGLLEDFQVLRKELRPSVVDDLLREFAALLQGNFRRTDYVARIGEAQFAVVAVDAVEPSAAIVRQRLQRRLEVFNNMRGLDEQLKLRVHTEFWNSSDARTFSQMLEVCESGLRNIASAEGDSAAAVLAILELS